MQQHEKIAVIFRITDKIYRDKVVTFRSSKYQMRSQLITNRRRRAFSGSSPDNSTQHHLYRISVFFFKNTGRKLFISKMEKIQKGRIFSSSSIVNQLNWRTFKPKTKLRFIFFSDTDISRYRKQKWIKKERNWQNLTAALWKPGRTNQNDRVWNWRIEKIGKRIRDFWASHRNMAKFIRLVLWFTRVQL